MQMERAYGVPIRSSCDANRASLAWQVMNEVALHRGSSPHLNTIDVFVDGQHLTEAVVSMPHHSTADIASHARTPVRRHHSINTYRFHCLFFICRRTNRSPLIERHRPHAHLSTKSVLPTIGLPLFLVNNAHGGSFLITDHMSPPCASRTHRDNRRYRNEAERRQDSPWTAKYRTSWAPASPSPWRPRYTLSHASTAPPLRSLTTVEKARLPGKKTTG